MKKITKVLLGLLAGALAVGFASCKQVQDVNVVDEYSSGASYVCDATGTITLYGTEYAVSSGIVTVSWSYNNTYDTDMTTYTLRGFVNAKASGDTTFTHIHFDTGTDSTTGEMTYKDISDRFTNSPSDSTFTYTTTDGSLTFTRM